MRHDNIRGTTTDKDHRRQMMLALLLAGVYGLALGPGSVYSCSDGDFCSTDQVKHGFCINSACVDHIPAEVRDHLRFKIVVKYPELQLKQRGLPENMYILGNGLGFNWATGAQMTKTGTDTWEQEVTYTSSDDGFRCESCADQTPLTYNKLEYRVFLHHDMDMQGANLVVHLPVSSVSSYFHVAPEIVVHPWFIRENGTVSNFTLWSRQIGDNFNIAVYTPPSFTENSYKKYPVLIAIDVWYDFAENVRYIFDNPINTGFSGEYIIVGFGDYNVTGLTRADLLTPTIGDSWACINGTSANFCGGCLPDNLTYAVYDEYDRLMKSKCGRVDTHGGLGDATLDFLTTDVLRKAQTHCQNRILLGHENVGIMGYSLGGLISCHAAWTRPHVFGMAACQSSSFWWPLYIHMDRPTTAGFDFINQTMKNPISWLNRPRQKIYIDVGGEETVPPYIMDEAAVEVANLLTTTRINGNERQFKLNKNVWVHVFPGDHHNLVQWAMRTWKAIHALLPVPGAPSMAAILHTHGPHPPGHAAFTFPPGAPIVGK